MILISFSNWGIVNLVFGSVPRSLGRIIVQSVVCGKIFNAVRRKDTRAEQKNVLVFCTLPFFISNSALHQSVGLISYGLSFTIAYALL